MELVNNLNLTNLTDFLKSFKTRDELVKFVLERGILFTTDDSLGLTILRYNREHPACNFQDPFTRFCRGLIIDREHNIVCLPPGKHIPFEALQYDAFENLHVEDFIDGTMINMFYYGEKWHIATRSKIGANGTWFSKKKFSDMFEEAQGNLDFSKFETNYTYTFVLRHPENRIVTQYESADLVLVQVRNMSNLMVENTEIVKRALRERGVEVTIPVKYHFTDLDHLNTYLGQMSWQQQGVVIKYGSFRSKLRNQKYKYVKQMRSNNPKMQFCYLELMQNKMIKEYLQYFPEFKVEFNFYWLQVSNMIRLLHQTYMNYRVKKLISIDSVPYELRPLVYELHGHHLKSGIKITPDFVKSYFQALPIKKIIFVLNYQRNHKQEVDMEAPVFTPEPLETESSGPHLQAEADTVVEVE